METSDLLEIWGQNDRKRYTDQDFEAIRLVLVQRLGSAPPQKGPGLRPLASAGPNSGSAAAGSGRLLLRSYLLSAVLLTLLVGLLVLSLFIGLELFIYLFGNWIPGGYSVVTPTPWLLVLGTIAILPLAFGAFLLARRLARLHQSLAARLEPESDLGPDSAKS